MYIRGMSKAGRERILQTGQFGEARGKRVWAVFNLQDT
jgi:hypothetical protein